MKKNKIYFWLKVALTIVSGILAILLKCRINWPDALNIVDFFINHLALKEFIYDISIGVFSAMILVWFIDEIAKHIEEQKTQKAEKETILRLNRVLEKYLSKYERCFYCVITPVSDRCSSDVLISKDFSLKDMRDLFQPSLLPNYGLSESSISSFLQIELDLRHELTRIIERNSFVYYPRFVEILSKYIEISLEYDCRTSILEAQSKQMGGRKMIEVINEYLSKDADKYKDLLLEGKGSASNIMFPYVLLNILMHKERKILDEYKEEIQNIL